jgi:amino acid adenylation domain-containing protein
MSFNTQPSCCIIGTSSLLVKCAKLIIEADWNLQYICSSDDNVAQWSAQNAIPFTQDYAEFKKQIIDCPPDYLFSIVNEVIIDEAVLNAVKQLSINYHDALLPDYAGMYATFWALYHQEIQHGITWHIMQPEIDSGPILIQKVIDIEVGETTLSLNLKCYEQAISGFQSLLKQIEEQNLQVIPQNASKRRYNGLYKRPENAGVINFNQLSATILKQWQAFEFGNTINNTIGTPKIQLNDLFFVVSKMAILPDRAVGKPGTIYQINEKEIIVNTQDCLIQIKELKTLLGSVYPISLLKRNAIKLSYPPIFYDETIYTAAVKKEWFWVNRLTKLNYLECPFIGPSAAIQLPKGHFTFAIVPPVSSSSLTEYEWLSLLVLFLARVADNYEFDIAFYCAKYAETNLFSPVLPLKIQVNPNDSWANSLKIVSQQIQDNCQQAPILNDVIERYPQLKNHISSDILQHFKLAIEIVETFKLPTFCGEWHIQFDKNNTKWQVYFNDSEVNRTIAKQLATSFQTFVNELHHNTKLLETNILTEAEQHEITVEQNQNKIDFPNALGVHQLFEYQVATQPDAIALVMKETSITYQKLNECSNQIAHALVQNGFNQNDKVGILLNRSIEHIAAMLGILKAGGCYVPLPPEYPTERLQFMVSDSAMECIISESSIIENSEFKIKSYIDVNKLDTFSAEKFENQAFHPDDSAYVIYTSGSTGNPKGVPISHLNVVNFLYSIRSYLQPKYRRIGAVTAPFNFDVSVEEIYSTICFGGTAHIIPNELLLVPNDLVQYLFQHKINTIFITPVLLPKLTEQFTAENIQHLKYVLSGVQSKQNGVFKPMKQMSPDIKIVNTYGPTEVTFGPTAYTYKGTEIDSEETPIGKALPNYALYIVNRFHQLVPDFVAGELIVGGPSVMKGYLNLPDLNREKLIQLPFVKDEKLYATGDRVYRDANGNLHFLGRKDNQVKIRGFRIETGEVEAAIKKNESVETCVVVAKTVNQNYIQLVAFVKFKANASITFERLKLQLDNILPNHAIPAFFVKIDDLPLLSSGKINYAKLPDVQPSFREKEIVLPQNETETKLYTIWQAILQQKSISIDDNFFEIGGDSLTAIEVIAQFQKQCDHKISLAMFYNFQTIKSFAAAYNRDAGLYAAIPLIQLKSGEKSSPLFFIHGLNGSIAVMNHIVDSLDVNKAIYAFQADSNYDNYNRFEALAAHYVDYIKSKSIKKCVLCGFSFGGILAFEMAHQLQMAQIEVKLIQLDSKPIVLLKHQRKNYYKLLYATKVLKWLMVGNKTLNRTTASNTENINVRFKKLKSRLQNHKRISKDPPKLAEGPNIYQKTLLKSRALVNRYRPKHYNIDMVLIKSTKEKEGFIGFGFEKNGWSNFTKGNIQIENIEVYHYDFDKIQHAQQLAQIIQKHSINS